MSKFPALPIFLDSRQDRDGNNIYLGKMESPVVLKFKKGVAFFVFTSEPGCEEIKVGKPTVGSQLSAIKRSLKTDGSVNRYHISLEKKMGEEGPYYMALVQDDTLELDIGDGYLFFVFTSKIGSEQIQIVKKDETFEKPVEETIEVYSRKESGTIQIKGNRLKAAI